MRDRIEADFVYSELHRRFYQEQIGAHFSFNLRFQKWLKANTGKTYQDSILAYAEILTDKILPQKNGSLN